MGVPTVVGYTERYHQLKNFISEYTSNGDRILVETGIQSETKVFSLAFNREFIGSAYPRRKDPSQFVKGYLWQKKVEAWSSSELKAALNRWGVSWVFVLSEGYRSVFVEATGNSGTRVDRYYIFKVPAPNTKFLIGSGDVNASINRISLQNLRAKNGIVVIKYRYHPAWKAPSGVKIHRYEIPEDAVGFIALENPPQNVVLQFDPIAMLKAQWPL
jgi:hypothetical protein